jgi:translation initiation factor 1
MSQNKKSERDSKGGEYALVYSTDPISEKRCSECSKIQGECLCAKVALPINKNVSIRIEKKGRGGKVVTLVEKLPAHEFTLEKLCKSLKKSIGAGGTYYITDGMGVVEIQGERKAEILEILVNYK